MIHLQRRLLLPVLVLATSARSIATQGIEHPGKVPYDRVCSVCHGPEGRGDVAPRLVPLEKDYDEVLGIVRDGLGEMTPTLPERLTDEEVKQIVEYLKSLKAAGAPASASPHAKL